MLSGIINRKHSGPLLNSHKVWNENNPTNVVKSGEVIHHKDRNPLNDDIANLEKMLIKEHTRFHHKGKVISSKQKILVSAKLTGRKLSEETKKKIGLKSKGNKNMLGKTHSQETKGKMSKDKLEKYKTGKMQPFCTGKFGIRHPAFNHIVTAEHRKAISKAQSHPKTEEHKLKLSLANTGKKQSAYTIEKRRQTLIQIWKEKKNA